jgi:hypothetical protein
MGWKPSPSTPRLRYGKAPPGGFPPPLEALGIPKNALDNAEVNELALGHFVTSRTFILLHEMGHILQARSNRISADPIQNEEQADRFAATVMKRTPLRPLGCPLVELSAERIRHSSVERKASAYAGKSDRRSDSRDEATSSGREVLRRSDDTADFRASGQAGNFQALAPRRTHELPGVGMAQPHRNSMPFQGVFRGQLVQFSDPTEAMQIELSLRRDHDNVTGRYTFGLGVGTICCTTNGDRLYFDWQWGNNFGKGVLEVQRDRSFAGTWGYRESRTNAGTWNGSQQ